MKQLRTIAAFAAILCAPGAAWAQSSMMSSASMSSGPHAYDWMLGTWTCANAVPSALAGPATQTLTATRSTAANALFWRYTGKNYDQAGFLVYNTQTKTWLSSWAYSDGSHGDESTMQTGKKTYWTGSIYDKSNGKLFSIHDTYTVIGAGKFNDLGSDNSGGSWKTGYNGTCVKS